MDRSRLQFRFLLAFLALASIATVLWVIAFYSGAGPSGLAAQAKAPGFQPPAPWLHPGWLFSLRVAAILAFCGYAFLRRSLTAWIFAGMLVDRLRDRALLVLGLSSGGYMLLFFGYVENYAPLCLGIALFLMTGVLITRGKLKRWLIVLPLAVAVFFHLAGLALVPAAFYVLAQGTPIVHDRGNCRSA